MPEPEEGAAEELNPTVPDTTPADPAEPAADDSANALALADSKIADLTLQLTVKDQRIVELTTQLDAAKAHNYDLLMAGGDNGGEDDTDPEPEDDGDEIDPESPSIEDILYEKA